jgi:hypothetical protein
MVELLLWSPASQKTYAVYMRCSGWTTPPTASECYLSAEYYDQASGTRKALAVSAQAFQDNNTWTEFNVTITPQQVGIVRLRCYLGDYEDGSEKIYVDIKPVVT